MRKALITPFRDRFEIELEAEDDSRPTATFHEFEVERDGDEVARRIEALVPRPRHLGIEIADGEDNVLLGGRDAIERLAGDDPAATTTAAHAADPQGGQTPLRVVVTLRGVRPR